MPVAERKWATLGRASIERHLFLTAFFGCVQPQTGRVQRHTQAPHSVFPWWNREQHKKTPCLLYRQFFFSLYGKHCARKCTRATRLRLYKNNNNRKKAVKNKWSSLDTLVYCTPLSVEKVSPWSGLSQTILRSRILKIKYEIFLLEFFYPNSGRFPLVLSI